MKKEDPLKCHSEVITICNTAFLLTSGYVKRLHCKCYPEKPGATPIMMTSSEIKRIITVILKQGDKQHHVAGFELELLDKEYHVCKDMEKKLKRLYTAAVVSNSTDTLAAVPTPAVDPTTLLAGDVTSAATANTLPAMVVNTTDIDSREARLNPSVMNNPVVTVVNTSLSRTTSTTIIPAGNTNTNTTNLDHGNGADMTTSSPVSPVKKKRRSENINSINNTSRVFGSLKDDKNDEMDEVNNSFQSMMLNNGDDDDDKDDDDDDDECVCNCSCMTCKKSITPSFDVDFGPDQIDSNNDVEHNTEQRCLLKQPETIIIDSTTVTNDRKVEKPYIRKSFSGTPLLTGDSNLDPIKTFSHTPKCMLFNDYLTKSYAMNACDELTQAAKREKKTYLERARNKKATLLETFETLFVVNNNEISTRENKQESSTSADYYFWNKENISVLFPNFKYLKIEYLKTHGRLFSLLNPVEATYGYSLRKLWTYIYSHRCSVFNNERATGLDHISYRGCGKCDACWNRLAQVLLSVFAFQGAKDNIALPHLYYIFHCDEEYSTYDFNDWADLDVDSLIQVYGPTSMYGMKAASFHVMIGTIRLLKKTYQLTSVPRNREFYMSFSQFKGKSTNLALTAEFGHHIAPGIPNDVHVTHLARGNKYFDEAKQTLNLLDVESSPDITRLLELVFDPIDYLEVNERVASVAMCETQSKNFSPFTYLIFDQPKPQQKNYALDLQNIVYRGDSKCLEHVINDGKVTTVDDIITEHENNADPRLR